MRCRDRYLNHSPSPSRRCWAAANPPITFDRVPIDDATRYAAEDADITLRLWQMFKPRLHASQVTRVYETLERPLVPVLAAMERHGHKGGPRYPVAHVQRLCAENGGAGGGNPRTGGRDASMSAAPSSLAKSCSTKCRWKAARKARPAPMPPAPIFWKIWPPKATTCPPACWIGAQLSKLKSTYTDALQDHIHPDTGRVHTSYVITGAVTGRLSSTDPNLQNIPSGRKKAAAFARPSWRRRAQAGRAGLQPDRAAHSGAYRGDRRAEARRSATGRTFTP